MTISGGVGRAPVRPWRLRLSPPRQGRHPQPDGDTGTSTADGETAAHSGLTAAPPGQSDKDTAALAGWQGGGGTACQHSQGTRALRAPACLSVVGPRELWRQVTTASALSCSEIRWKHVQDGYADCHGLQEPGAGEVSAWTRSLPNARRSYSPAAWWLRSLKTQQPLLLKFTKSF